MKNVILTAVLFFGFLVHAQSPQIHVKGKDSSLVRLSQLKVDVKVVGNIAYTTTEMHFFNGTSRQMEAELLFPLPEGVSVSRYAIDINGKMREAVPVNKNKGKQVFEAIEHRRVDPGLLEKVEGNNFKTRIYPLLPNKERIIIIGYEQELSNFDASHLSYQMLTTYKQQLDVFELTISVVGAASSPTILNDSGVIAMENLGQNYVATLKKNNYQPKDKLVITIPIQAEIPSVAVQSVENQHYFYANTVVEAKTIRKKKPSSVGLIWDVSLSCSKRDVKKELELLDAYFKELNSVEVALYFVGYNFEKKNVYSIKNGDWSDLKGVLQQVNYDGGTRFSKVKFPTHDEYLFFTDGLSSLSSNVLTNTKKPVYTISSLASSDYAFLNFNAIKTGGNFINLNQLNLSDALNKLQFQSLKFLGIKDNYMVTEIYPMVGTPVSGSFSMCGISLKKSNEIVLQFGYDETPILEKTIIIDASNQATNEVSIEKLWAQKKIAFLEINYKDHAAEIETLGKKYGIVTQNTSLIVLEALNDYIQYEIIPPAELRDEFDRIMKQRVTDAKAQKQSNWKNVETYYNQLLAWWKSDVKYQAPKPIKEPKPTKMVGNIRGVVSDKLGTLPGANVVVKGTTRGVQTDMDGKFAINAQPNEELVFSFIGMNDQTIKIGNRTSYNVTLTSSVSRLEEVVVQGYRTVDANKDEQVDEGEEENVVSNKSKMMSSVTTVSSNVVSQSLQGSVAGVNIRSVQDSTTEGSYMGYVPVKMSKWNPDRIYLKALSGVPSDKKYGVYLQLREDQINNPSFYFDVANHFYDTGDREKALLILSNIADLGLENHQLYKSLTYVLRQWEAYDDALFTASQVAKWREHEPQSHRDLALALEDTKHYQAAFDALIKALEVNYYGEMSGQYSGVEDIILMDINRIMSERKGIDSGKLEAKYVDKMPVGIRIILNWNQMDTDIDLHIVEPTGEECFYGHRTTEVGAYFSKDFTEGYGPEQYLLRNSVQGKYIIKTNYFGESALTENGPTTVMVEIYVRKANGTAQRKLKTIQLGSVKENENLAEITIE